MTAGIASQCFACKNLDRSTVDELSGRPELTRCLAFPDGIPDEMLLGGDHREPIGGEEHGLVFDLADSGDARTAYDWWEKVFADGAPVGGKRVPSRIRRKHTPNGHRHNQQSHAGGGVDLSEFALDGIQIYDADKYKEIYGDVQDDAGVRLGDDNVHLMARYFENGDMHVSWDLPGDKGYQVLEEMDVESMRQLADDIEKVLDDYDYGDINPDDYQPEDAVFDVDSDKHGFYIYADRDGDLRIDPEGGGTSKAAFDISAEQAREFVAALNDMADGYEDHFEYGDPDEKSAGKPALKGAPIMATKSFNPTIKAVGQSGDQGTATFKIASFNEVDKDGDVTLPGFFGEQHAQLVPVHDWNHVPIGKGRVYEMPDGVYCDAKFNLKIPEARNWYEAIKFDMENPPALQNYSYGYEVLAGGSKSGQHQGRQVRYLQPMADGTPGVKVFEVSPVLQGAGMGTHTVSVKGASRSHAVAGVIPAHEAKTVSRIWARTRMENELPEGARPSELRTVYAWVDPDGDPELKSSYSFPHHHGIGGPANLRACLTAIAALNGPAGEELGEAERKGIYEHLAAHLRDAERKDIPDLRTGPGDNSKNRRFSDEAVEVLAQVGGLIDRASDVMAMRRTKGKQMATGTADLLSWVADDLNRLKALLSQPVAPEQAQPAGEPTSEQIASLIAASIARINGI